MALLVKTKHRLGNQYGDHRTVVTYRLFGLIPVFRRSRPPRSGYGQVFLSEDPTPPAVGVSS